MFKRYMIGLAAVGLVIIFMAQAANATVRRIRRTVENYHDCNDYGPPVPCYNAVSVTDKAFGAVWIKKAPCDPGQFEITDIAGYTGCYESACEMTGTLICATADICGVLETTPVGLIQDSFESEGYFGENRKAIGISVLDTTTGEQACIDAEAGRFYDYKPDAILVLTTYSFASPPDYALIEVCPTYSFGGGPGGSDQFLCQEVWNSDMGEQPRLPCCGEVNTLTVTVEGQGTVTSDPVGIINCVNGTGDCSKEYNGLAYPYDGCPEDEITLTASAADGWEFHGWSGGGSCNNTTEPCTVTAEEGYGSVTAVFWPVLTVEVDGAGTVTSDPEGIACSAGECSKAFDPDTTPTVKLTAIPDLLGDVVTWTGTACNSGSPEGECIVPLPANVKAAFSLGGNFIRVTVTGNVPGQRVWIQDPNQTNFTFPDTKYCRDVCVIDTSSLPFQDLEKIVIKRKGGEFLQWIGEPCSGVNNSVTTCDIPIPLTGAIEVTAAFP